MTCVIGLEHKGRVYIGGDSSSVGGNRIQPTRLRKVFRLGPFLIGYTWSFRMGQLLQHQLVNIPIQNGGDDVQYLVRHFIEPARQCFKDYGFARNKEGEDKGGQFLLGYKDRLYLVASDYQVNSHVEGYDTVGSGGDFALGAMAALVELSPKKRIRRALAITARYATGVCGPFYVEKL